MRKSFLAAAAAALALSTAGVAYAQTPDPSIDVDRFCVTDQVRHEVQAEVREVQARGQEQPGQQDHGEEITITLPSTLKLCTKGLDQCTASDDELIAGRRTSARSRSPARGTAHALVNPFADRARRR